MDRRAAALVAISLGGLAGGCLLPFDPALLRDASTDAPPPPCGTAGGPACVTSCAAADEGRACLAGSSTRPQRYGTCHRSACCAGCWDEAAQSCSDGASTDACGARGAACAVCSAPTPRCLASAGAGACVAASRVTSLGVGAVHTCAVREDGSLWCWGAASGGQLGIPGRTDSTFVPLNVSGTTWRAVVAGDTTCGLQTDDSLWCWGTNESGQIGQPVPAVMGSSVPLRVTATAAGVDTFRDVALGTRFFCATARDDGRALCWGLNDRAQCGATASGAIASAQRVGGDFRFAQLASGGRHACGLALAPDAMPGATPRLRCWGDNAAGQLGTGDAASPVPVPTAVVDARPWASFAANDAFTCGVRDDQTLWCWGRAPYAAAGTPGTNTPSRVDVTDAGGAPVRFARVAAHPHGAHVCALDTTGAAWCWGANDYGQLGIGARGTTAEPAPRPVMTALRFAAIGAGQAHTCGLTAGGVVYCWGQPNYGQLGLNGAMPPLTQPDAPVVFPAL